VFGDGGKTLNEFAVVRRKTKEGPYIAEAVWSGRVLYYLDLVRHGVYASCIDHVAEVLDF